MYIGILVPHVRQPEDHRPHHEHASQQVIARMPYRRTFWQVLKWMFDKVM